MKYNLKNRPHVMNDIGGSVDNWEYRVRTEEWLQSFEKELREMLESLKDEEYLEVFRERDLIKDILGEELK